jgi:type III restriction enzyme
VNLEDPAILKAMSTNVAQYVCVQTFKKELLSKTIEEQKPKLEGADRFLSGLAAFPWSRPTYEGKKTILNLIPCDNEFEEEFARFLDKADDVKSFSKIPQTYGFAIEYTDGNYNLRNYYPDFVAVAKDGTHWLLETKGMESEETEFKDRAAALWCENATSLTKTNWRYKKVPQQKFKQLQPSNLSDLAVI